MTKRHISVSVEEWIGLAFKFSAKIQEVKIFGKSERKLKFDSRKNSALLCKDYPTPKIDKKEND